MGGEAGRLDLQAMTLMFLVTGFPEKYRKGLFLQEKVLEAYQKSGKTPPFTMPYLITVPGGKFAVIQHTHMYDHDPLSADQGNMCDNPTNLEVWAYEGDGEYSLYEDKGDKSCVTVFKMTHTTGKQVLEIVTQGDFTVLPKNRTITVLFRNITEGNVTLLRNGTPLETNEQYENCASVSFAFDSRKEYKIVVEYREQSELERLKSRAKVILTLDEGQNGNKEQFYKALCHCQSTKEFFETIKNSNISQTVKARLTE